MVPLKPAERYKQFWSESVDKKKRNFTRSLSFWCKTAFSIFGTSAFSPSLLFYLLSVVFLLTQLTILKDLAKHNYVWRQTNISVTSWVCGFSMVMGIVRKDLRNMCEFISFILGEILVSFTLNYEVFETDLRESRDLIFRRAWTLPIKK